MFLLLPLSMGSFAAGVLKDAPPSMLALNVPVETIKAVELVGVDAIGCDPQVEWCAGARFPSASRVARARRRGRGILYGEPK